MQFLLSLIVPSVTLAASWPSWALGVATVAFIAISILMILAVLVQKPQGGGLAGAFGGASSGSGQTAFGTKTGDALTVFTCLVFAVFVVLAVTLNFAFRPTKAPAGTSLTPSAETQQAPVQESTQAPADTTQPAPIQSAPVLPAPVQPVPAEATPPAKP